MKNPTAGIVRTKRSINNKGKLNFPLKSLILKFRKNKIHKNYFTSQTASE
jgi:hypothetical protein